MLTSQDENRLFTEWGKFAIIYPRQRSFLTNYRNVDCEQG